MQHSYSTCADCFNRGIGDRTCHADLDTCDAQSSLPDRAEALELSRSALETVRAEGVRQLSEQCTLCVAHLLQLAVGLVEVMNGDQPAPEAPAWPEAASGKALLLRHFARHMVSTLDDVVEVYMTALSTSVRILASHVTK